MRIDALGNIDAPFRGASTAPLVHVGRLKMTDTPERFQDRRAAGRLLAGRLAGYAGVPGVVVLGLPRGGVPVAYEVALALQASLDVFVVRKLGVPDEEELAMGAIAGGGVRVLNEDLIRALHLSDAVIERVARREQQELERREIAYRGGRPAIDVQGQAVIVVDDGLATGATMRAAVLTLRRMKPTRLVVGVPTAAPDVCRELAAHVDEIVCLLTPVPFYGVGYWYDDFSATSDEEVRQLLALAGAVPSEGRHPV
jgi:putative phosphoribosyl transferase